MVYEKTPQQSFGHSGVVDSDGFCYTLLYLIVIKVKITYKNIYPSNYSKYQEKLYNRIKKYKDHNVSPLGWTEISNILNSEGLKTTMGKTFKSNHVHSIYKKGKIREERLNSKPKVTKRMIVYEFREDGVVRII